MAIPIKASLLVAAGLVAGATIAVLTDAPAAEVRAWRHSLSPYTPGFSVCIRPVTTRDDAGVPLVVEYSMRVEGCVGATSEDEVADCKDAILPVPSEHNDRMRLLVGWAITEAAKQRGLNAATGGLP